MFAKFLSMPMCCKIIQLKETEISKVLFRVRELEWTLVLCGYELNKLFMFIRIFPGLPRKLFLKTVHMLVPNTIKVECALIV